MKKITLSLLSFFMVFMLFGQKLIQNPNIQSPQSQTLTTAPLNFEQLANDLVDVAKRTPDGKIRCFSTEYQEMMKLKYPNIESTEEFESWLAPKVAEYKANVANGTQKKVVVTIPVIMHIIHNSTESVGQGRNISQAQATSQITILNNDFRKLNADVVNTPAAFTAADLEINFVPALRYASNHPLSGQTLAEPGIDRVSTADIAGINNTTTGYSTTVIDATIKPATYWDRTEVMNVWVCQISGGILGYAQFPTGSGLAGLTGGATGANTDGLVLQYTSTGTGGVTQAPYNKGRTATHEIGHWVGLRHIWGDDGTACTGSDFCADTPNQGDENYGCPSYPATASCSNGGDMWMNYMDYSDDACMYMFTEDQKARVQTVLANSPGRSELPTSTLGSPLVTTAQFVGTPTTVNVGSSVTFTDQSQSPDNITSWTWSFPGGTPNSFVGQTPPAITYAAAGQYNVTLVITDDNAGGDTETKTNYINVINAAACDTLINIDLINGTDTLAIYNTAEGYAAGWNEYAMSSNAEKYSGFSPYTYVTGVEVYLFGVYDGGNGATVDVNVWSDNASLPNTILGTTTYTLAEIETALGGPGSQGVLTLPLDASVNVGAGPFYVGLTYNGFNQAAGDTLGLVSKRYTDPTPINTGYTFYNGSWSGFGSLYGGDWSLFISPHMSLDAPTATISTNTTTICAGETVDFDASSSVNTTGYNWVFNGGSPTSATTATATVTYAAAGTPRAYLIVDGNCGSYAVDSVDITVNTSVTPTFTQVGPYCVGDTPATLPTTSNNGVSGTWNAAISTTSAGTVTYTFTPSGGACATTATMDVVVSSSVTPTFTQVGPYCVGDIPATLPTTSNNSISGTWNAVISTASAGTVTYTFTPSGGGCATFTTMDVVVNANVTPTFTQVGPYCVGDTPATLPTTSNNGVSGTWNAVISTASAGTVTYTFTPSGGCATTATMDVVVNAPTVPTFTQLGPYCVGDTPATLPTTSNNGVSGSWNASISTASAGTITYTFTPSGGCTTVATMDVLVNAPTVPTFTQMGPYCIGATAGTLPTTSNNGVSGTWNATISTASAGTVTYTFTPSGGCATTATMDVVVSSSVTPTFTQVGPYCVGDTPATLPITSNNGVSGSWNAVISTANAGTVTYTFTPSGSGCELPTTMDVVVNTCVGINEINTATVLIYPNPASETLIIETANLEVDEVRLINILGETLVSDRVNNSIIKMNVSEFSMGVYFVQLVDTKGQVMRTEKVSIR